MKGLLLDTHVWLWLLNGNAAITPKHRKIINDAAQTNDVFIAAISLWEVSMLAAKERIIIEKPVLAWMEEGLALPGIAAKPLTPEIAADSCQLPGDFHGDPADRLIIATARIHSLNLLTHDQKIINYARKKYISVIAV